MAKEKIKINLSTAICMVIITILVCIIVAMILLFIQYKECEKKYPECFKYTEKPIVNTTTNTTKVDSKPANTISIISSNSTISNNTQTNNIENNNSKIEKHVAATEEVNYEVNQNGENKAIIKATKDGKTLTKELEMNAIARTGTMELPTIGKVAFVADTGGEYYGFSLYQLINGEIKHIGGIDCGADMSREATYEVTTNGENIVSITANFMGEIITSEFKTDATITKTEVIDMFNMGKVVLVSEIVGDYYTVKAYRLSRNYVTGKAEEILEIEEITEQL